MANNHCFTNGATDLIAYSFERYDGVKDIVGCTLIYKKAGKYYNKDKSRKRFIKAFQVQIIENDIGKLISPMLLTEEILHTHFWIRSMNLTHWGIQRIRTNKRNSKKQ